jgi:hypothetical protein
MDRIRKEEASSLDPSDFFNLDNPVNPVYLFSAVFLLVVS